MGPRAGHGVASIALLALLSVRCAGPQSNTSNPSTPTTQPSTPRAAVSADASAPTATADTTSFSPTSADAATPEPDGAASASQPVVVEPARRIDAGAAHGSSASATSADGGHLAATHHPAEHPDAGVHASAGAAVAAGLASFNHFCNNCHPDGGDDVGPRLRDLRWTEARMRTQIRQGSGTMRGVTERRLPEPDLANLIAFLRTLHAVR